MIDAYAFGEGYFGEEYFGGVIGPVVSPNGVASQSTVGSPAITQPAVSVTPNAIATATATVGAPTVNQGTPVAPDSVATAQQTVGTPAITQSAVGVVALDIATASAAVGAPTINQISPLAPLGVSTAQATVGAPTIAQIVALTPDSIVTASQAVGSPSLTQAISLTMLGLTTEQSVVGAPQIRQSFAVRITRIQRAMISIVKICNLALTRIGVERIDSLTESSAQAVYCNMLYEPERDALLRRAAWRFATARQALADLTTETNHPPYWSYVYQLPSDYIAARYIEPPIGTYFETDDTTYAISPVVSLPSAATPKFEVWGRTLMTNQQDAVLVYTKREEDPTTFDPLFVEALSYKLAAEMAEPLQADRNRRTAMLQETELALARAKSASGADSPSAFDADADWITARA